MKLLIRPAHPVEIEVDCYDVSASSVLLSGVGQAESPVFQNAQAFTSLVNVAYPQSS